MKIYIITKNAQVIHSFESLQLAQQCLNDTALQLCKEGFAIISSGNENYTLSKAGQQLIVKLQESELQTNSKNSISKILHNLFG